MNKAMNLIPCKLCVLLTVQPSSLKNSSIQLKNHAKKTTITHTIWHKWTPQSNPTPRIKPIKLFKFNSVQTRVTTPR